MSDQRFEAACNHAAVQINGKSFSTLTSLEQVKLKKQVRFILAAADSYDPLRADRRRLDNDIEAVQKNADRIYTEL